MQSQRVAGQCLSIENAARLGEALHGRLYGEPSHIILVVGLDPNPFLSFDYWPTMLTRILQDCDLDGSYNANGYVLDLRRWLPGPGWDKQRRASHHEGVLARLWEDYPFAMLELIKGCRADLAKGFFLGLACKSGIHRSASVARAIGEALAHEDACNVFIVHLSLLLPSSAKGHEIYKTFVYDAVAQLVVRAMSSWLQKYSHKDIDLRSSQFLSASSGRCLQKCETCAEVRECQRNKCDHRHHQCRTCRDRRHQQGNTTESCS